MRSEPLPKPRYSGDLPIHQRRDEIIESFERSQVVVIAGETGSGKTTQIPKFLLDCGIGRRGMIGCTQPRRVAALSVAQRIAEELGVAFGGTVGAKIRFTDATRPDTLIKVMTDGILLNELQDDPLLKNYEAIVIDEAHERSLNIDFILGCLRRLRSRRPDLKIVITSATIDTESFAAAFDQAPVIEVTGRTYPVQTYYRENVSEEEDTIELAAQTAESILKANTPGDCLIFLPAERDIHELRRRLADGPAARCDLLPLFGRMASSDQQRIFHPGGRRRIILSTNIAETSLTVPGIRFVIDTGLARISRYSPASRTQRLPIEAISQSSADQRKGRCGRVADGECYRLYSEQEFLGRPRFTTPEIRRANLASVILRMMAFRLGDIRSFPFIDPPNASAIENGFRLLAELGAVANDGGSPSGDGYRLTDMGRRMARIPVDPTVARMLLHAQTEGVEREVLIIAAGLSIRDPRERPAEQASEADAMHRRFVHPESDFLTLLNIWNAYHEKFAQLSQGKLRRFCADHFLAYQRMREWRDIHDQLERSLSRLGGEKGSSDAATPDPATEGKAPHQAPNPRRGQEDAPTAARYAAIHRSILTGLLSNVARKVSGHDYLGPRSRKALLFPGSVLFDNEAAKKQRKANYAKTAKGKSKPLKTRAPEWIVCGEWMETSRVFARTAARIEVSWIESLARDHIQIRHSEPFWSDQKAAALCRQRRLLFGLELSRHEVSYSRIDPAAATDMFVRNGLVEGGIRERPPFLAHNDELRKAAESELARRQEGSALWVEDRLFDFYRARLDAVGSFPELRALAKKHHRGAFDFLQAALSDLLPDSGPAPSLAAFPHELHLGGEAIPLRYVNAPGTEDDGINLRLSPSQFEAIRESTVDWAVPGLLEAKITALLKGLPKAIRIQLHPLKERAAELCAMLEPSEATLRETLRRALEERYKITTYGDQWKGIRLPQALCLRLEVVDNKGVVLAAGRDVAALRQRLAQENDRQLNRPGLDQIPAWQKAVARIERRHLTDWNFGDLPKYIDLGGDAGLPLRAYPALVASQGMVDLRLERSEEAALAATLKAWPILAEACLGRDLAWVQRDLKELKSLGPLLLPLGPFERVKTMAWEHLRRYLLRPDQPLPLQKARFDGALERARKRSRGIAIELRDRLKALLEARQQVELLLEQKKTAQAIIYPGMRAQLASIAPADCLERYTFEELGRLTLYLRAMLCRAERARANIRRDMEKAKRVEPFQRTLEELTTLCAETGADRQTDIERPQDKLLHDYRLHLEEFKVSVFAQELGTTIKISEKRLDQLAQAVRQACRN